MEIKELPPPLKSLNFTLTINGLVKNVVFHPTSTILAVTSLDPNVKLLFDLFDDTCKMVNFVDLNYANNSRYYKCIAFHPRLSVMLTGISVSNTVQIPLVLWNISFNRKTSSITTTSVNIELPDNIKSKWNGSVTSATFHESLPFFAVCWSGNIDVSIFKYEETGESLSNVHYICSVLNDELTCYNLPLNRRLITNIQSLIFHPTKEIFVTNTIIQPSGSHVYTWEYKPNPQTNPQNASEYITTVKTPNLISNTRKMYVIAITRSWLVNSEFILAGGFVDESESSINSHQIAVCNFNSEYIPENLKIIEKAHDHIITSIVFHPVKRLLISCSIDKSVKFWDITTFETELPMTVQRYDCPVKSISICPNKPSLLVVATYNETTENSVLNTENSVLNFYNIMLESYNDKFRVTPYTEDASFLRSAQQRQRSPYQRRNIQRLIDPPHLLGRLPPSATSRNLGLSNKRKGGNKTKRNRHKKTRNFRSRSRSRSFHKKRKYSIRR